MKPTGADASNESLNSVSNLAEDLVMLEHWLQSGKLDKGRAEVNLLIWYGCKFKIKQHKKIL